MPSRNRIKVYVPESYYHVYNRGINKRVIFKDDQDYAVFLNLLKRYLSNQQTEDKTGRLYDKFNDRIELLAFCFMPNHFHLLLYQKDENAMTALMRRISTSYTGYFNKKHRRSGPLFQERFKASRISNDEYLQHVSRYMHLNPQDYKRWNYSSLKYYMGRNQAEWVKPDKILSLFNKGEYGNFVQDYEVNKKMLNELKYELADA